MRLRQLSRVSLGVLVGLVLGVEIGLAKAPKRIDVAGTRPNILLINLDDTRADGIDRMPTLLSRVAAHGVSFRNSFVPDALCAPSRASILTGLYARHHGTKALYGVIGGASSFRESGADRETVAVWLQAAGYDTGLFGKYINGYSKSEAHAGAD